MSDLDRSLRTPAGALQTLKELHHEITRALVPIQDAISAKDAERALQHMRDLIRRASDEADWAATQLFDGNTAH